MTCIVKKIFVITLFLTILVGTAEGMDFGIKAGTDISSMNFEGMQSRVGFCGGGFATIGVDAIFVIQPEVMYTQKGAKWEHWYKPQVITLKLDYIDLPLLFKFMLPVKGAVKPNLFVGYYFAINFKATHRIDWINSIQASEELDYDEFYEDNDFGLVLGGGVDFSLTKGRIVLDGRYTMGLTRVQEVGDLKNKVVSFMLGYSF